MITGGTGLSSGRTSTDTDAVCMVLKQERVGVEIGVTTVTPKIVYYV